MEIDYNMHSDQMFSRNSSRSRVVAALAAGSSSVSKSALVCSAASLILVVLCFAVAPWCDANDGLTAAERLINQGCDFDDAGRVDEAISCFKKAMALEPRSDVAVFNLGNAYLNGKHDDSTAKVYIRKAIDLNPREAKYWNQLSLACGHLKDLKSAEAAIKRSISIEPTCGRLLNLARIYRDTGRLKECREIVLKAKSFPQAKTPELSKEIQVDLEWLDKHSSDK